MKKYNNSRFMSFERLEISGMVSLFTRLTKRDSIVCSLSSIKATNPLGGPLGRFADASLNVH